jgi:hypothetical protein
MTDDRVAETLAFLSGGKVRAMPAHVEPADEVDWHAVACQQVLSGRLFPPKASPCARPSPTKRIGARAGTKPGSQTRTGRTKNVLDRVPPTRHVARPALP